MSNVDKLPDSYKKNSSSNNHKLLYLNEQAIADIKTDATAVLNMLDLEQCTGETLNLYGNMVGQKRGALTDEQYRYMIYTRIGINTVQGNYNTVIEIIKRIFNCNDADIILNDGTDPCTVSLTQFPLQILIDAGFTHTQAAEMIESLLPVGVRLDDVMFQGTFEFAETADVYDEDTGFGNEAQTIGGYLGLA